MTLREQIQKHGLIFEGAMGTYFQQKYKKTGAGCELAVLQTPELILDIHREYLAAGAQAIKTDTFGANRIAFQGDDDLTERVIRRACELARQAAEDTQAFVFGDIGPITETDEKKQWAEYQYCIDCFLENGIHNFLFETHASAACLKESAEYIRARAEDAYIIASFSVQPDGYTREGIYGVSLCRQIEDTGLFDAVGYNCVSGAHHMLRLMDALAGLRMPMIFMPNAGYPTVIGNRTFYQSDPKYFGEQLARMVERGAAIIGGCCGTTPEYIKAGVQALQAMSKEKRGHAPVFVSEAAGKKEEKREPAANRLWERMNESRPVIAVELDPPKNDNGDKFMAGARRVAQAGADVITIADCPIARPRADSSLLACKVHREVGIQVLPHMTCRDRNLNATKALLLGLCMEGIHNVLMITGDPLPTAERDEVKTVYQFNSRKFARYVSSLNETELTTPFRMFGALNVNARKFEVQLHMAKEKAEYGMSGFFTQPVLTEAAYENLQQAREELPENIKLFGGILPVVSAKNAYYMDSEISGISVDMRIAERMEGKDRKTCQEISLEISNRIADEIAPYIDGYYLMTPFMRTDLIADVIAHIRSM